MSFGARVKEQREKYGLSRKDLADLVGVTASAIANYENGISSPKAELLYPLMDALKCDANYLYRDEMDALGGSPMKLLYEEIEHIKKYRDLDQYGKDTVTAVLDCELKRTLEQKEARPYVESVQDRIDSEVESYRHELELEASQADESSASGGADGIKGA